MQVLAIERELPRRSDFAGTISYLVAHFAKSQLWHASALLFGFFLTESCGLHARTMGAIMAASLAFNGVMDAALGQRWKHTNLSAAMRRQAIAAPVTCMFFMAFCATPLFDPTQRALWALVTLIAFRAGYSFIDVPQNAAVIALATGPDALCALLAGRNIVSGMASMAVSLLVAPILIHERNTFAWLVWASGVSLLVCVTASRLRSLDGAASKEHGPERCNGDPRIPFPFLLGILAVMMVAGATFRSLEPYYAAFADKGVGLLAWAAVGSMVTQPLWVAGRRRFGSVGVLMAAGAALSSAAVVLLGPWRTEAVGVAIVGLGFGVGVGGLWLMLWSAMMTHAATGRPTGHVGIFTCVSKLAQAAAMLLLGHVLDASSYRMTLGDPWSAPSLLMTAAPIAIACACVVLMFVSVRLNRTACDGTPAMPRRAGRTIRVRGRRPR